jgi:hypothetical protein
MGSPSSAQMGTTKSVVSGRVVMGISVNIRVRGVDEGADGVAIFYPAKKPGLLDPPGHETSTV